MSDRYAKQRIFLGRESDAALRTKRVAVLGMGALGSVIAPWLARAGVGHLTLIDRDLVEASNLQRQLLYGESDLGRPKAEIDAHVKALAARLCDHGHHHGFVGGEAAAHVIVEPGRARHARQRPAQALRPRRACRAKGRRQAA